MKMIGKIICISLLAAAVILSGWSVTASAEDGGLPRSTGLPIPRFVSLRSDKVFVRTGPGLRYPIKWVYQRENLPVEVVQEFDTWRKIRDMDGDEGWVHGSLVAARRFVVVKSEVGEGADLRDREDSSARKIAKLEDNVVAALKRCEGKVCEVETSGYEGWTDRKSLYGIYPQETF